MWQRTFVGVSVLLGASIDEAIAALPEGLPAAASDLEAKLRDGRRAMRAQGLAVIGQEVAVALGEVTLR
ncbi:MAG: hypothetical protein JWP97_1401 [Labilithrix sp.]|nr:hypothetical protein [Labilithrix sp.]